MTAPAPHLNLVIADDNEGVQRAAASALAEFSGIAILACTFTIPRTLQAIRDHTPDVVLLETELAGESGLEVLRAFHGSPGAPLFLFFTQDSRDDLRAKCREIGALDVFAKDRDWARLLASLQLLARLKAIGLSLHPPAASALSACSTKPTDLS